MHVKKIREKKRIENKRNKSVHIYWKEWSIKGEKKKKFNCLMMKIGLNCSVDIQRVVYILYTYFKCVQVYWVFRKSGDSPDEVRHQKIAKGKVKVRLWRQESIECQIESCW